MGKHAQESWVTSLGYLTSGSASSLYQPLDSDLTAIASLPTSSNGVLSANPEVIAGTTWTTITSNFENSPNGNIRSVSYSGSSWVAGGDNGAIRTSTNGTTWTTVTSNFGSNRVTSVFYGNGIWVAGGYQGQIRTSTNGSTWTTVTSNFGTSNVYSVAYANGRWLAGAYAGEIRTSTDAITWTTVTSNFPTNSEVFALEYANNLWLAGGDRGHIRTSTNGLTWTTVNSNMPSFGSGVYTVAYGNGLWLAGGYLFGQSHLQSSTDTITWTTVSTSNFANNYIRSIEYANDLWVAASDNGQIRTSTNGSTWTTVTSNFNSGFSGHIGSVSYGNGMWVAGGNYGNMRMSQGSPMSWTIKSLAEVTSVNTNAQTASYSLVLSDAGKTIEMNVGSANNVTIPLNSSQPFPIGTSIDIIQYGSGQTTIVATGGVTLRSKENNLKLTGQYSGATLYKRGTDEWVVVGDLTT